MLQHSIAFDGCNRMIREGESLDVRNNIDPAKATISTFTNDFGATARPLHLKTTLYQCSQAKTIRCGCKQAGVGDGEIDTTVSASHSVESSERARSNLCFAC